MRDYFSLSKSNYSIASINNHNLCTVRLTIVNDIARIGHVHLGLVDDPIDGGHRIANGLALHLDGVAHLDDACARALRYNRKACGCFIACNKKRRKQKKFSKCCVAKKEKKKSKEQRTGFKNYVA